MDWKFILAVFVAFLGSATLNIGKGVQKMNVHVFKEGWGMFRPPHRRQFGLWMAGLGMTASLGPCQWLAMQLVNNPSLPVAMMGMGLVALVLFAIYIIGEKLAPRETLGISIIIISTFTLVYTNDPCKNLNLTELEAFPSCVTECSSIDKKDLKAVRECCATLNRTAIKPTIKECVVPRGKELEDKLNIAAEAGNDSGRPRGFDLRMLLICLCVLMGSDVILAAIALLTGRIWGFSFGYLAGSVNGIALTLVKVAALSAGSLNLVAQLKGPWLYLGLLFGIFATVFTQIGFWKDRALIVVPTYTSLTMMTPAVLEYFVFGFSLSLIQYMSLGTIVAGVIILCSGAPEAVISGDFSATAHDDQKNGDE